MFGLDVELKYPLIPDISTAHTMYRKVGQPQTPPENFELPFNGQLSRENRWVVMASLISWEKYEDVYASLFSVERGAPALNFRIGLGALIIKEKLGIVE